MTSQHRATSEITSNQHTSTRRSGLENRRSASLNKAEVCRYNGLLSVPKILTLFIPEILSHPAQAGRAKTLPVPRSVDR